MWWRVQSPLKEWTEPVYLDMRHAKKDLRERFPGISAFLAKYELELSRDLIPVRPAAHYLMGGVRTDVHGRTTLPGLYAAGEVACTGVHGANRLASNSLLEGLVFGALVAETMVAERGSGLIVQGSEAPAATPTGGVTTEDATEGWIAELRKMMWKYAGSAAGRGWSACGAARPEMRLAVTMPRGLVCGGRSRRGNLHAVAEIDRGFGAGTRGEPGCALSATTFRRGTPKQDTRSSNGVPCRL